LRISTRLQHLHLVKEQEASGVAVLGEQHEELH
jgi:hypothetical protein